MNSTLKRKKICQRHNRYLAKFPRDYQVMCCKVNESGVRSKRKASLRCPVGLNESNDIHLAHECASAM